jgi:(R,R)-butanediol dehydrogenase/meso-butanediol dehydrogenase/diacetyl reductase
MRAAYCRGHDRIEFAEVPTPHPGPGEVVIRVAANGVCGSDHKVLASPAFPLDQVRAAYDLFGAGEALKVLVEP